MADEVEIIDADVLKRAAELAAQEFERNASVLNGVPEDERRFHEDVILDAALKQAREEIVQSAA